MFLLLDGPFLLLGLQGLCLSAFKPKPPRPNPRPPKPPSGFLVWSRVDTPLPAEPGNSSASVDLLVVDRCVVVDSVVVLLRVVVFDVVVDTVVVLLRVVALDVVDAVDVIVDVLPIFPSP